MTLNHKFQASAISAGLCSICYQVESAHLNINECDSCDNITELHLVGKLWLCPSCENKEALADSTPVVPVEPTIAQQAKEVTNDHKPVDLQNAAINRLGMDGISRSEAYFNARTIPLNERWKTILADDSIPSVSTDSNILNKHERMTKEAIEHFREMKSVILPQVMDTQIQVLAEMSADQSFINFLASGTQIREEIRAVLHVNTPSYTPPATPKKAPKVAKADQLADFYAKKLGIPLEQAKRYMENRIREEMSKAGVKCTCAETPGICDIHVK